MNDLLTRVCGRCGAEAPQVRLASVVSEPLGWATITITGLPVCNRQVCPGCAKDLRAYLALAPNDLAALRDAERAEDFRRGYEDGCDDTERSHACARTPSEAS